MVPGTDGASDLREREIASCQFPPLRPRKHSNPRQVWGLDFQFNPLGGAGKLSPQRVVPDEQQCSAPGILIGVSEVRSIKQSQSTLAVQLKFRVVNLAFQERCNYFVFGDAPNDSQSIDGSELFHGFSGIEPT